MAQFCIQLIPDMLQGGWTLTAIEEPGGVLLECAPGKTARALLSRGEAGDEFPLPPIDEAEAISPAEAYRPLCLEEGQSQRVELLNALLDHQGGAGEVKRMGRYLFDTLIGAPLWKEMVLRAQGSLIDLYLAWPSTDKVLNRLPWESMHPGENLPNLDPAYQGRFLAACARVTLIRRVSGATAMAGEIQTPPRVLFVIGSEITNDVIRPGAEYLGLLRRLNKDGIGIHSRLVFEASAGKIEDAVLEFSPDVVHIMSHGVRVPGEDPYLQLFPDDPSKPETGKVTAARLVEALRTRQDLRLPPLVVLNACALGAADELDSGRPFATDLVERGVPVVLGMGGNISDQACRMFTEGFYQALLADGQIARAAARGRRAAMLRTSQDSLDWCLPVLFMSRAMTEPKVSLAPSQEAIDRQQAARQFTPDRTMPFCDRLDMLQLYTYLVRGSGKEVNFPMPGRKELVQTLAISNLRPDSGEAARFSKFGRTWLLEEMAAQAVRDGHVPVLLSLKERVNGSERYPDTLKDYLLNTLYLALYDTVQIFNNNATAPATPITWQGWLYLDRLYELQKGDPLPGDFPQGPPYQKNDPSALPMVSKIVALELRAYLDLFLSRRTVEDRAIVRLVLLLDDLHRFLFLKDLIELLVSQDIRGLKDLLRVVVMFETVPTNNDKPILASELEKFIRNFWVYPAQLDAFHKPYDENWPLEQWIKAKLVYKQYMLNWVSDNQLKPLVLALPEQNPKVMKLFKSLAFSVKGIPSILSYGDNILFYALELENLRLANDDDTLKNLPDEAALPPGH